MESQKVECIESESKRVATRAGEMETVGKCWSKGTKLQLYKMNKYRDLMYSVVAIVNNTVSNTGNLP